MNISMSKKNLKLDENHNSNTSITLNNFSNNYLYQSISNESSNINNISLYEVISSYVNYYASGKGHTSKAKKYDLEYFLKFIASKYHSLEEVKISEWTMQKTIDFVDYLLQKGESPSTVARRLATIKHLGRTLADRVPGFINPAREVKAPVYEVSKPQGLSADDIILLRESARIISKENENCFKTFRNYIIIEFLLGTGLRADEVRFLKRSQVDDKREWIKNVKTKGKRFRDVYVHNDLRDIFSEYLEKSRQEIVNSFPASTLWNNTEWGLVPVFISTHKAEISKPDTFSLAPKTLWRIIADFGKKVRLINDSNLPHLHPHKLRHTFAHGLLSASNDIRLVAQALGHSDVRTTMRYTERTKEEMAKAIEKKESLLNK